MSAIMEQLRADHENFAEMLGRLEAELDNVRDMETAEIELMREMMHYLTHYPDAVHHPREDIIFARLVERDAGARAAVDELVTEHRALAAMGTEFLGILNSVIDGAMVEREALEALGRGYVAMQRGHIAKEEGSVLDRAEAVLLPKDWASVEAGARPDPLFGAVVEQEYRDLHDLIKRSE